MINPLTFTNCSISTEIRATGGQTQATYRPPTLVNQPTCLKQSNLTQHIADLEVLTLQQMKDAAVVKRLLQSQKLSAELPSLTSQRLNFQGHLMTQRCTKGHVMKCPSKRLVRETSSLHLCASKYYFKKAVL